MMCLLSTWRERRLKAIAAAEALYSCGFQSMSVWKAATIVILRRTAQIRPEHLTVLVYPDIKEMEHLVKMVSLKWTKFLISRKKQLTFHSLSKFEPAGQIRGSKNMKGEWKLH